MNLKAWYKKRGISFILERARRLNERYSFRPRKSVDRIERCMDTLRGYDCYPTFAVPGIVVERGGGFIRHLQETGAEIAVHGYNHVDLKACPPEEASRQLDHAAKIFRANGLEAHGFRCPYLSASDELLKAITPGAFDYSSNKAIQWPINPSSDIRESLLFETIKGFYAPQTSDSTFSLPWFQDGLVEIPVCVPDDLQLHDGLGYGLEQISQFWLEILHQTYQRGEIFNLMFHPELASFCEAPFVKVIQEAKSLQPKVWLARLREISEWWREKSAFTAEAFRDGDGYILNFHCTHRATILYRGFDPMVPAKNWDGSYFQLETCQLKINSETRPFIGLAANIPHWVRTTLRGMGYILETNATAPKCSLYIDENCLGLLGNAVALVDYIERDARPLVRFWPWPDGARSALCITGDLDALSFLDYAVRLLKK
jgi:peptidoglycan/xylan/chitin deacetylase (PgdA/CDA1 family)